MLHRHLNHQSFTLAAIDDIVGHGKWRDWAELRRAALQDPLEVDAVLEGSWGSWAIEVKTGSISSADLRGIGEFTRRNPAFRPLILCDEEARSTGLPAMAWKEFLLSGPPGTDRALEAKVQTRSPRT